jgi:hypothetical protein
MAALSFKAGALDSINLEESLNRMGEEVAVEILAAIAKLT